MNTHRHIVHTPPHPVSKKRGLSRKGAWRYGLVVVLFALVRTASSAAIPFSAHIDYHEDFAVLGTKYVVWDDGNTPRGWYLRAAQGDYTGHANDGIPGMVYDRDLETLGSSGAAYHVPGSTHRTLIWVKTSTTGLVYMGNQFQHEGGDAVLNVKVLFNMEQWKAVKDSNSAVTLQYRITNTGGNILNTSGWTTVEASALPNTSVTGNVDGRLSGNQFTLGGTLPNVSIRTDQYLSFRVVGNVSNGTGFGVNSVTVSVEP